MGIIELLLVIIKWIVTLVPYAAVALAILFIALKTRGYYKRIGREAARFRANMNPRAPVPTVAEQTPPPEAAPTADETPVADVAEQAVADESTPLDAESTPVAVDETPSVETDGTPVAAEATPVAAESPPPIAPATNVSAQADARLKEQEFNEKFAPVKKELVRDGVVCVGIFSYIAILVVLAVALTVSATAGFRIGISTVFPCLILAVALLAIAVITFFVKKSLALSIVLATEGLLLVDFSLWFYLIDKQNLGLSVIPYIVLLFVLGTAAIWGWKGYNRGLVRASVRLITIIISFVISFGILALIFTVLDKTGVIGKTVESLLNKYSPGAKQYLDDLPATAKILFALPLSLMGPFIFVGVFYIVKALSIPLSSVIGKLLSKKIKVKPSVSKYVGLGIGALTALFCVLVMWMPTVGMLNFSHTFVVNFEGTKAESSFNNFVAPKLSEIIDKNSLTDISFDLKYTDIDDKYIAPFAKSFPTKLAYYLGGKAMFKATSTASSDGKRFSAYNEALNLAELYSNGVDPLLNGGGSEPVEVYEYGEKQSDAVGYLTKNFNKSAITPIILSELIVYISEDASNGVLFDKSEKPIAIPDEYVDMVKTLTDVTKKTTPKELSGYCDFINDAFNVCLDHGVFATFRSDETHNVGDGMIDIVARPDNETKTFLGEMLVAVKKHPNFNVAMNAGVKLGIRIMCDNIGIASDIDAAYDKAILDINSDVTIVIDNDRYKKDDVIVRLRASFSRGGLEISKEFAAAIKENADKFGVFTSAQETTAFYLEATRRGYDGDAPYSSIVRAAELNARFLEIIESYKNNETEYAVQKESFDAVRAIADIEVYRQTAKPVLAADMVDGITDMSSGDALTTGDDVSHLVYHAIKFVNTVPVPEDNRVDKAYMESALNQADFDSLGDSLDSMKGNVLFESILKPLCVGTLRTRNLSDAGLFDPKVVTLLYNYGGDSSYKDLLLSMKNSALLIITLQSGKITPEEFASLIATVNPDNVDFIKTIFSPDALRGYGINLSVSSQVSLVMNGLLDGIAVSNVGNMNIEGETQAVIKLYQASVSSLVNGSGAPLFGNGSAFGSADAAIGSIIESNLAMTSVLSVANNSDGSIKENPLGNANGLKQSDKNQINASIDSYYDSHKTGNAAADEKLAHDLASIAALYGINR